MNINLKYLTITVGSIFLALGIGIFIGLVISTGNIVENQTGNIVTQIEEQFEYLKDENKKNREEIEKLQEVNSHLNYTLSSMSGNLIDSKLVGKNVAILNLNTESDNNFIKNILERSGANITSNTYIKNDFYKEKKDEEELEKIAKDISNVLLDGSSSDIVVDLSQKELLSFEGSYSNIPEEIVIVGGFENEENRNEFFERQVFENIKNSGKSTLGVEKLKVKNTEIPLFKEYGFSTVDNVDQNIGYLSLVIALKGLKGNYGEKNKGDIFVPDISILE